MSGKVAGPPGTRAGAHDFDLMSPARRSRVQLRRALASDIPAATELVVGSIGGQLAQELVVERVLLRNPNNLLLFWRGERLVGTWSMLMLNSGGIEALLTGDFDPCDPAIRYLSAATEAPAAIYIWAVVAPGLAAEGIHHVSGFLRQPLYFRANLYARPATSEGLQLSIALGFQCITGIASGLLRYVRDANAAHLAAAA